MANDPGFFRDYPDSRPTKDGQHVLPELKEA